MDDSEREGHLEYLQACAVGPTESLVIHEGSLGKALVCALLGALLAAVGLWLFSLLSIFGPLVLKGLLLGSGMLLLVLGLAALGLAEALRRRHGTRLLEVTPETLRFVNSPEPVPWHTFEAFEVDQRHLSTVLLFTVSAFSRAPALQPACFKSLVAPDAVPLAGGLRVKVWVCTPTLTGKVLHMDELVDLLYGYLEAAQARRTLAQLFPGVERLGTQT